MENKNVGSKAEELEPINIYEEIVKKDIMKIMKDLGACQCKTCFSNACALALNELHPQYVTTRKGELLSEITTTSAANHAEITVEVTKAVMKVMMNPHH